MADATLELVLRARDESNKVVQQSQKQWGALAATMRFVGGTVLAELNPALAAAASQLQLMGRAGAATGALLAGGLVTGGIVVASVALAGWIQKTKEQIRSQVELNQAIREFDIGSIISGAHKIQQEIEIQLEHEKTWIGFLQAPFRDLANWSGIATTRLKDLTDQLEKRNEAIRQLAPTVREQARIRVEERALLIARERNEILEQGPELEIAAVKEITATRLKELANEEQIAKAKGDITRNFALERQLIEGKAENEILAIKKAALEQVRIFADEEVSIEEQKRRRQILSEHNRASDAMEVRRKLLEGGREHELKELAIQAKHGSDQFRAGVLLGLEQLRDDFGTWGQDVSGIVRRSGQAWGRALDDSFFFAIKGKTKELSRIGQQFGDELLRSFTSAISRGIVRQHIDPIIRQIERLFGGNRAGPGAIEMIRPTLAGFMGTGIPQAGGGAAGAITELSPWEIETGPGGGFGGLLETTSPFMTGLGGVLGVGLGVASLVGAIRAQDPFSAIIGGVTGGLGIGLGASALMGAAAPTIGGLTGIGGSLGAMGALGPLGAIAGVGFGIAAAFGAARRQRQQRAIMRARGAAASYIERIRGAMTIEQLDDLLDEMPRAILSRRVPGSVRRELLRSINEARLQAAAPLMLEQERGRIAGASDITELEAILATPISPDIPGAAELRLEIQRRREEMFRQAEEVGGVSIDENIEGGVRRRTIVGAGAFGLARAGGRDVTVDRARFRRLLRETLQDDSSLREWLIRMLRSTGQGIDLRLDDLEALS